MSFFNSYFPVITQRKIGHSAHQIREYIDKYDTKNLHGDYAELLLKYVPTKDEVRFIGFFLEGGILSYFCILSFNYIIISTEYTYWANKWTSMLDVQPARNSSQISIKLCSVIKKEWTHWVPLFEIYKKLDCYNYTETTHIYIETMCERRRVHNKK